MTQALLAAYAAVAAACVAWAITPGQMSHLTAVMRPVAAMALIPVAWTLIQIVPLPVKGLWPSIWVSAREALNDPVLGSISIDPGATIVALSHFFSVLIVMFLAAAVSIERERAERMLSLLIAVATLVAVTRVGYALGGPPFLGAADVSRTAAEAIGALGVVLAAAAAMQNIERFEIHRRSVDTSFGRLARHLALYLGELVICSIAVISFAARQVIFATACGVGTLVWIFVARRLGLGAWSRAVLALVGVGAAGLLAFAETAPGTISFTLRSVASPSSAAVAITQRIMSDVGWTGSGAGTFPMLFRIYRSTDEILASGIVPTTAAKLGIELGWPAVWAAVLIMIAISYLLLRGSLQRVRDSGYATAASGAAVLLTLEAFADASLANGAVATIAAALIGLGLVQTVSRLPQEKT